jgi:hypothetical protein
MERNHILDIVKIDFSPPIFIVGNLVFFSLHNISKEIVQLSSSSP